MPVTKLKNGRNWKTLQKIRCTIGLMTVGELMAALSGVDPNLEVRIRGEVDDEAIAYIGLQTWYDEPAFLLLDDEPPVECTPEEQSEWIEASGGVVVDQAIWPKEK